MAVSASTLTVESTRDLAALWLDSKYGPSPKANSFAPDLPIQVPSLNGLRAVAISLVLIGHVANTHGAPQVLESIEMSRLGNVGVRLFFVISGFLITTLLLREIDRFGRINLRHFYLRRALRIFPASFAYIFAMCLCHAAGWIELPARDLWHAVTYTANYNHKYSWYLNHLWSLSVEEQFYLLWPSLLFVLGVKRGIRIAIGAIFLVPLVRGLMVAFFPGPDIALTREFQAVADSLFTGCFLSLLHRRLSSIGSYVAFISARSAAAVGALLLFGGYAIHLISTPLSYVFGQTVSNLGAVLMIDHAIRSPGLEFGRLLNTKAAVAVGVLSYSLYLWQEPFLYFRSNAWIASFPVNIILVFLAAICSYYFVERPFLKKKDALSGDRNERLSTRFVRVGV